MRPSTSGAPAPGFADPAAGAANTAAACAWAVLCLGLLAAHLAPSWLAWGGNGLVLAAGAGLGLAFALGGRAARAATLLFGASLTFFVFQPYANAAQALDVLALCSALGLIWRNLAESRQDRAASVDAMPGLPKGRSLLLLFALVAASSLLLLPLGRILDNARSLGFLAFFSWLWGAQPTELVYPLASLGRLAASAALAWQWSAFARRPGRLAALWLGLGLGTALGVALELGALAGWWGFFWWPEGFERTPGRLSGAMGHPTWFGMFAVLLLPGLLAWPWRKGWAAVAGVIGLGIALFALALSQTRAAWLLVAVQAGVVFFLCPAGQRLVRVKTFKIVFAVGLAACVLAGAAYLVTDRGLPKGATNTVGSTDRVFDLHSERYRHWSDTLAFIRRSPWLGYGYDSFRLARRLVDERPGEDGFPRYESLRERVDDPHQWYLHLLYGAGPLALVLWLAFAGARLRAQATAVRSAHQGDDRALAVALVLSCAGAALYGLFQNLQYPPAFFTVMLLFLCSPLPGEAAAATTASRRSGPVLACLACAYLAAAALSPKEGILSLRLGYPVWRAIMGEPPASGVYPQEKWPQGPVRWTGKRAFFDLPPGRHGLTIVVRRPDLQGAPLMLALEVPGQPAREWLAGADQDIPVELDLPGADGQATRVTLRCSKVFVPRLFGPGWDGRYLGVAVRFHEPAVPERP